MGRGKRRGRTRSGLPSHAAEGEPVVPVVLVRGPNTTRIEVQVVPVGSGRRNSTRPVVPVVGGIVQRSTIHVPRPGEIQHTGSKLGWLPYSHGPRTDYEILTQTILSENFMTEKCTHPTLASYHFE